MEMQTFLALAALAIFTGYACVAISLLAHSIHVSHDEMKEALARIMRAQREALVTLEELQDATGRAEVNVSDVH